MDESPISAADEARYELRYVDLHDRGRGYAFPCDARGRVALDALSDRGRSNYFYARAVVGAELAIPIVTPLD